MKEKVEKCEYSNDETLEEGIELIKKGCTYEEVQRKLKLLDDDMDLIDFVINEF